MSADTCVGGSWLFRALSRDHSPQNENYILYFSSYMKRYYTSRLFLVFVSKFWRYEHRDVAFYHLLSDSVIATIVQREVCTINGWEDS